MKRKEEAMKKYIASFLAITQPALKAVSCTDIATGAGGLTGYVKWVPHCVQKMVIPHRIFCCIITLIAGSYPAH